MKEYRAELGIYKNCHIISSTCYVINAANEKSAIRKAKGIAKHLEAIDRILDPEHDTCYWLEELYEHGKEK